MGISDAPPSSFWSRSSKLLSLAAGLAGKELQGRVGRAISRGEELAQSVQKARVQIEQAKASARSLGQLKGAAMKAGQLLSMELRDVLDLALLERIARLFLSVQSKDIDLSGVFAELRTVLVRENDYRLEADSLERYRLLDLYFREFFEWGFV